ncbi:hypothetical protein CLV78_107118 [Aliiruegeria haliotis]|uniref:Uncharacterized protein n=1 Tax=Aliiruegeria haliotis TaxID=1280846 RepID=A0A2T0RLX7_9RHOB|nr:hypothetical protein [Aliiruegeria haliotis]PRY22194.1 hypothetical protein CLV78_107118 [Aliiruegeria haliotis]
MATEFTAIIARNEPWQETGATEPYEAGWAREAVIYARSLKPASGAGLTARVQMSPDGIRWVDEGTVLEIPEDCETVAMARVAHFGNWLRLSADLGDGGHCCLLLTLHLKD